MIVALVDHISKVGWTVKFAVIKSALIALDDFGDSIDSRVEDISVESEAVRSPIVVGRDRAAEAVQIDHLILIVELENVANGLDGMKILISVGIHVMQRLGTSWITI